MQKICHKVIEIVGDKSPAKKMLEIALKLEELALKNKYFIDRKIYPNVDFYTGIVYKALGIP